MTIYNEWSKIETHLSKGYITNIVKYPVKIIPITSALSSMENIKEIGTALMESIINEIIPQAVTNDIIEIVKTLTIPDTPMLPSHIKGFVNLRGA